LNADELRTAQAPLKDKYRRDPPSARYTFLSRGQLDAERLTVKIETGMGKVEAGLHTMAGGDGTLACSGDMLMETLAACAGVTLQAVATAMGIGIRAGTVCVEGDADFRGTLGVEKSVPVGCQAIRVHFDLDTDATAEQLGALFKLTERYCVIYQTLQHSPMMTLTHAIKKIE
jgi:uncharacterized OsmC-like protein